MLDLTSLDDAHLGALCKALHEARFCSGENDPVVWASPLVVDLHVWALDEQRRRDQAAARGTDWDSWLVWSGREEVKTVVRRLRAHSDLLDMVDADRELFRAILRPFIVSDDSLVTMIIEARLRD